MFWFSTTLIAYCKFYFNPHLLKIWKEIICVRSFIFYFWAFLYICPCFLWFLSRIISKFSSRSTYDSKPLEHCRIYLDNHYLLIKRIIKGKKVLPHTKAQKVFISGQLSSIARFWDVSYIIINLHNTMNRTTLYTNEYM